MTQLDLPAFSWGAGSQGPMPAAELWDAYAEGYVNTAQPESTDLSCVRANMVTTLNGMTCDSAGRSGGISGPADVSLFGLLRAMCDVIVVGASTAATESYGPPVLDARWEQLRYTALETTKPPTLCLVTRSGEVPDRLAADLATLIATTPASANSLTSNGIDASRLVVTDDCDPAQILQALRSRGLPRVLHEGGPRLLSHWLNAGQITELCLTTSSLVVPHNEFQLLPGAAALRRFRLQHVLVSRGESHEEPDFTFARWLAPHSTSEA